MNPIKFIYEDFKKDVIFIKDIITGKYDLSYFTTRIKEVAANICTAAFWKKNWLTLLLIILAFLMGYLRGAWHYEGVCNQFILDNFYNDTQIFISSGNFTIK